ncbi:hypothetical protein K435DRAFT_866337 [Dendrothele bispora CBS 962.96]|uniref:Uncharacterized protein n=1 Tax=Dendrothele bispora (strain CBS 962.96) TaxID=1314807 RepID=A0A4S8LH93_DENBC|nr:hypothetical protein K435DRAFT_866337 [Dendrothele bispora CBS 962.96]
MTSVKSSSENATVYKPKNNEQSPTRYIQKTLPAPPSPAPAPAPTPHLHLIKLSWHQTQPIVNPTRRKKFRRMGFILELTPIYTPALVKGIITKKTGIRLIEGVDWRRLDLDLLLLLLRLVLETLNVNTDMDMALNHPYKFYAYRNTAQSCPNNRTTVPSYSYSYSYHSPPPSSNPSDAGLGPVNCSVSHDHGQRIQELSSRHHNHNHNHNHVPRNMAKLYYPASVPSGEPLYVHDHHHGNGCGRSPQQGCVLYNSPEIGTDLIHHPNPNTSSSASTPISTSVSASPPAYSGPDSNPIFQVGFCASLGGGVRTGGEGGAHHHHQHQHHQHHQRQCRQQSQQHHQMYRVIVPDSGLVPSSSSTGDPGFQLTTGHGHCHTVSFNRVLNHPHEDSPGRAGNAGAGVGASGMYYSNYSQATATAPTTTTDLHLIHGHPQGNGMEVYS